VHAHSTWVCARKGSRTGFNTRRNQFFHPVAASVRSTRQLRRQRLGFRAVGIDHSRLGMTARRPRVGASSSVVQQQRRLARGVVRVPGTVDDEKANELSGTPLHSDTRSCHQLMFTRLSVLPRIAGPTHLHSKRTSGRPSSAARSWSRKPHIDPSSDAHNAALRRIGTGACLRRHALLGRKRSDRLILKPRPAPRGVGHRSGRRIGRLWRPRGATPPPDGACRLHGRPSTWRAGETASERRAAS
jgi:hypothetical protein